VELLRRFILACACAAACLSASLGGVEKATAAGQSNEAVLQLHAVQRVQTAGEARRAAIAWLSGQVYAYQHAAWRWERIMGAPLSPTEGRVLREMSIPDVQKAVALWQRRALTARVQAQHPPHLGAFLCIHRFEGSWTDAGGPYYGGLQMDLGFQQTYGGWLLRTKGTADHWTPLEQIWTAEKAARSRGFWPWPNTARSCGLI
jgi:hypothetical protein